MEEGKHPTSVISLESIRLGSLHGEPVEDHKLPIISLSKSSTEVVRGPSEHTESAWCRQPLRKSISSAACTAWPDRLGGVSTGVSVNLCDFEQGSVCSGNRCPERGIWHGGTSTPWSITEDPLRMTLMQDLLLGTNQTHGRVPHSPSASRDVRTKGPESGEGCRWCRGPAENFVECGCCSTACRTGSSTVSNSFMQQVANTVNHAHYESHHLTACRRSACAGHIINATCLRNSCSVVPCPRHLISRPACAGSPCAGHRSQLHSGFLGFPPLVSSVSETRLDSRSAGHCCAAQNDSCLRINRTDQDSPKRTVKDATTMTSSNKLKDVGVQTVSCSSSVPRMFPDVSLGSSDASLTTEQACRRTLVKEVEWDAEGMTWEVYGASVDPEELGLAIQKHLELQIKENAAAAAQREDSSSELQLGRRRKSESIRRSLCSSVCCSNSSTVEE